MKIDLHINGEKRTFTVPFAPNLAKRKYLELQVELEEKANGDEYYMPSSQEKLDEEDEMVGILVDVVFNGQFTAEQLHAGASTNYIYEKMGEAVFGKSKKKESEEGNDQGE